MRDSIAESHNLQTIAETLARGRGVELSRFHGVYQELRRILNIEGPFLDSAVNSAVSPTDIWGDSPSESCPSETKSDSIPESLSHFNPSLDTTSLPNTLVEAQTTSPVVIFSSGHPYSYFVRTGEDPLTYSLVEKGESDLVDPEFRMALTMQDIREQMELERVEDLYARELEEVFGIPFDNLALHGELIESSFD